jgi:DNA polymerase delta subunit 2
MPAAAAAAAAAGSTAAPPRPEPAYSPLPELASTFVLRAQMRNYNHQYANMYFARLVQLRAAVQAEAERKWAKAAGPSCPPFLARACHKAERYPHSNRSAAAGQPKLVDRVLDVQQGQLCYILGTVYMDMPLKPNVLEDITKDVRPRCASKAALPSDDRRLPPLAPTDVR